jgi:hypothetical protein
MCNAVFNAEEILCDRHWGFQSSVGALEQWNDLAGDPNGIPLAKGPEIMPGLLLLYAR